jgi:YfiH family protein
MTLPMLETGWSPPGGVRAAFTLRSGGASAPPWHSLNLGTHVGDDPLAVAHNRRRVAQALALPAEPRWLSQVHGTVVHQAGARPPAGPPDAASDAAPVADAAVTREAGVVLAIMVADCLPVLLAAEDGSVLGAAHAGWRGLVAGVIERTVETMGHDPARLRGWLGPCIGPRQFEVGDEVREAFLAAGDAPDSFEATPGGRWLCDLPTLARARLARLGVTQVAGGQWCTVADPVRFFSHRRDRQTGRMAALLWREPPRA